MLIAPGVMLWLRPPKAIPPIAVVFLTVTLLPSLPLLGEREFATLLVGSVINGTGSSSEYMIVSPAKAGAHVRQAAEIRSRANTERIILCLLPFCICKTSFRVF
jgi:hypothetical protein